jgi:hypothetical protein
MPGAQKKQEALASCFVADNAKPLGLKIPRKRFA